MKKLFTFFLLLSLNISPVWSYEEKYGPLTEMEIEVLTFWNNTCENIYPEDIPTIFIPWILASWYSEQWLEGNKIKWWVPDPITHVYDTLFYTFYKYGYDIKDVFYEDEFQLKIEWNPKHSLYLFWYDWKKDNKITAKLLRDLIQQIRSKYEQENGCDIGQVNIVAHSMWWLVARAMLENMCADKQQTAQYYSSWKIWKIPNIMSKNCFNPTRVHQLITIGTPQRWSPNSLPLWEKWDLEQTNSTITSLALRMQLWSFWDYGMYELIHGYNEKVKNGIVTIGQLLPDIWQSWVYNQALRYLYQNGIQLERKNHPKNSFLEELNTSVNLANLFENITGKYSLYYSNRTWNFEKNNIVWYDIPSNFVQAGNIVSDTTNQYKWTDIYSPYKSKPQKDIYNISENIRNENGLGWDGTVPSLYSKLVANDVYNPWMYEHEKFQMKEVSCYDIFWRENMYSLKLGMVEWQLCAHTFLPIMTALDVYEQISWEDLGLRGIARVRELYDNIGYINHEITTYTKVRNLLKDHYNFLFPSKLSLESFMKDRHKNDQRKALELWSAYDGLKKYEILSPINVVITDAQWRKIWIHQETGMIVNEIPWAWTSGDTDDGRESEFFMIPYTGSWDIEFTIDIYPTGEGEYTIVWSDITFDNHWNMKQNKEIEMPWYAHLWVEETIQVDIEWWKWKYFSYSSENEEKYRDLLEKLYTIIEKKYSKKQKKNLEKKLQMVIEKGNKENYFSEKVYYLIYKLFTYLQKNHHE